MSGPSPHELYARTGGGDAYRVAMLEHGYIIPVSLAEQRAVQQKFGREFLQQGSNKRVTQCGLIHMPDWSEWRDYEDAHGPYQARWCRICARVDARVAAGGETTSE